MAFEALPSTGAGSAEAGRVVRASWGEQVRLNFDDHEERIQDLEAISASVWTGAWAEDTAYNAGDIVQHNGSSWRASEDIPIQSPDVEPGQTSPDPWVEIAAAGQDGSSDAALDLERLHRALQGLAVYSGCAVTEDNTGAGLDVDVAAGHIRLTTAVGLLVTAGEVTLDAAHSTLPRIDIVWVNTSGTLGKTTGTAASVPVPPTLPSSTVLLASVARTAADDTVVNADITDKRTYTRLPQIITKSGETSTGTDNTVNNDPHLVMTAAASEQWGIDCALFFTCASNTPDAKFDWTMPTSSTLSWSLLGQIVAVTGGDSDVRISSRAQDVNGLTEIGMGVSATTCIRIDGHFINSTTAGSLQLRWAQNTSDPTAVVLKADSYIRAFPKF